MVKFEIGKSRGLGGVCCNLLVWIFTTIDHTFDSTRVRQYANERTSNQFRLRNRISLIL
jgi:hypothetical protein